MSVQCRIQRHFPGIDLPGTSFAQIRAALIAATRPRNSDIHPEHVHAMEPGFISRSCCICSCSNMTVCLAFRSVPSTEQELNRCSLSNLNEGMGRSSIFRMREPSPSTNLPIWRPSTVLCTIHSSQSRRISQQELVDHKVEGTK